MEMKIKTEYLELSFLLDHLEKDRKNILQSIQCNKNIVHALLKFKSSMRNKLKDNPATSEFQIGLKIKSALSDNSLKELLALIEEAEIIKKIQSDLYVLSQKLPQINISAYHEDNSVLSIDAMNAMNAEVVKRAGLVEKLAEEKAMEYCNFVTEDYSVVSSNTSAEDLMNLLDGLNFVELCKSIRKTINKHIDEAKTSCFHYLNELKQSGTEDSDALNSILLAILAWSRPNLIEPLKEIHSKVVEVAFHKERQQLSKMNNEIQSLQSKNNKSVLLEEMLRKKIEFLVLQSKSLNQDIADIQKDRSDLQIQNTILNAILSQKDDEIAKLKSEIHQFTYELESGVYGYYDESNPQASHKVLDSSNNLLQTSSKMEIEEHSNIEDLILKDLSEIYPISYRHGSIMSKSVREQLGIKRYMTQKTEAQTVEKQMEIYTIPGLNHDKNRTVVNCGDVITCGTYIGEYLGEILVVKEKSYKPSFEQEAYQFNLDQIKFENEEYNVILDAQELQGFLAYVNDSAAGKLSTGESTANIVAQIINIDKDHDVKIHFDKSVKQNAQEYIKKKLKSKGQIIIATAIRNILPGEALSWTYGDDYRLDGPTIYLNTYWSHQTPSQIWNSFKDFYEVKRANIENSELYVLMPNLKKILAQISIMNKSNEISEELSRLIALPILNLTKENGRWAFNQYPNFVNLFMHACFEGDEDTLNRLLYASDAKGQYIMNLNHQTSHDGWCGLHFLVYSSCDELVKIKLLNSIMRRNLTIDSSEDNQKLVRLDLLDQNNNHVLFSAIANHQNKLAIAILEYLTPKNIKDYGLPKQKKEDFIHLTTGYDYIQYAISIGQLDFLRQIMKKYPDELKKSLFSEDNFETTQEALMKFSTSPNFHEIFELMIELSRSHKFSENILNDYKKLFPEDFEKALQGLDLPLTGKRKNEGPKNPNFKKQKNQSGLFTQRSSPFQTDTSSESESTDKSYKIKQQK